VRSESYYIINLHSDLALEGGHSPTKDAKDANGVKEETCLCDIFTKVSPYLYQDEHQIDAPAQIWEFVIPYAPFLTRSITQVGLTPSNHGATA